MQSKNHTHTVWSPNCASALFCAKELHIAVRGFLTREKKVFLNGSFAKRLRVAHMFNHGWWRLAVGGWW